MLYENKLMNFIPFFTSVDMYDDKYPNLNKIVAPDLTYEGRNTILFIAYSFSETQQRKDMFHSTSIHECATNGKLKNKIHVYDKM